MSDIGRTPGPKFYTIVSGPGFTSDRDTFGAGYFGYSYEVSEGSGETQGRNVLIDVG
jgi:hypothetical protein